MNLLLGDAVEDVLQAHEDAGQGLFRGIRHAGPFDDSGCLVNAGSGRPVLPRTRLSDRVKKATAMGYSYDTWHFHMQNSSFLALAKAVPEATMVLDHFGTPLGVGAYADQREEILRNGVRTSPPLLNAQMYTQVGGLAMMTTVLVGTAKIDRQPRMSLLMLNAVITSTPLSVLALSVVCSKVISR